MTDQREQRDVRVRQYRRRDGTEVRSHSRSLDGAGEHERFEARKWQALAGVMSLVIAAVTVLELGFQIVSVVLMLILIAVNVALHWATHPDSRPWRNRSSGWPSSTRSVGRPRPRKRKPARRRVRR